MLSFINKDQPENGVIEHICEIGIYALADPRFPVIGQYLPYA
jgi:hypothetical protein